MLRSSCFPKYDCRLSLATICLQSDQFCSSAFESLPPQQKGRGLLGGYLRLPPLMRDSASPTPQTPPCLSTGHIQILSKKMFKWHVVTAISYRCISAHPRSEICTKMGISGEKNRFN